MQLIVRTIEVSTKKGNNSTSKTHTRSGAIMGRRSVRLSRSARLLPIPSSSFSSEEAEVAELELEVGVVELTKVLLTEAPLQPPLEPPRVSRATTGFRLEAPPLMLASGPLCPCCPCGPWGCR